MQYHAVTNQVQPRLEEPLDNLKKIKLFGRDNLYPQKVEAVIDFSGTAASCVDIYQDFIQGEGFEDETLEQVVVNRDGETLYDILDYVADDLARFKGFAIHCNFNLLGEIVSVRRLKFKQCRLGEPDGRGYVNKIAISRRWNEIYNLTNEKAQDVDYIYKFNPNPKVLQAQIEEAGGITAYKGQVFYYTPETDVYPKSPLDSVLEDIETDAHIKAFKNNSVKNNFLAFYIFKYYGSFEGPNDPKKRALLEELALFQGPNSKKVMLAELGDNVDPDLAKASLLEKVDLQDFDRLYEYTENSVKRNIIDNRKIPQALFSKFEGNNLGISSQIFSDACKQYNRVTFRERKTVKQAFEKIAKYFPLIKDRDFTIKELHAGLEEEEPETNQQNEITDQ